MTLSRDRLIEQLAAAIPLRSPFHCRTADARDILSLIEREHVIAPKEPRAHFLYDGETWHQVSVEHESDPDVSAGYLVPNKKGLQPQ